jgi:hypothetical protein
MARTNLSLGNLYRAVTGSPRGGASSISSLVGGSQTNVSLLGFATDAITINPPSYSYIVEGTAENASFQFSLTGSRFYTYVQNRDVNYSVTLDAANFVIGSKSYSNGPTTIPITANAVAASNYSEASSVLSLTYADGYNINATNYNTTTTRTLYAVDVYNTINQPDFCLLFDTPITKADNTIVNVEDLVVGDVIKSWIPTGLPDESLDGTDTEETEWRFFQRETNEGSYAEVTVKDITFNFASGYYNINNGLIKSTGTHPLYVFDSEVQKYKFKQVEEILPGDSIVLFDEVEGISQVLVYDISKVTEDVEIVTLNVENSDVYLSNGAISHNKGGVSTSQPSIPSSGLRMYIEPAKAASFQAGSLPGTGTPTVDLLDMSGYGTGVRPGAQGPKSLAGGNPAYNNGASRKERYYSFNGTSQCFYKSNSSNILGGISQFNVTTGTIHVWVRPTTTLGASERILFDFDGRYSLGIGSTNSSTLNRINFDSTNMGTFSIPTYEMPLNTWTMVTVAFNANGSVEAYANGGFQLGYGTSSQTIPSLDGYSVLTIGCSSGFGRFWNGQIGPVLFYNVKQNSTAIARVFNYFTTTYNA